MMEHKKTSSKIKKRIIFVLVFLFLLNSFLYYAHLDVVWDDYEAIESFSGNREHFDHIVKIVLKHSEKSNCDSYRTTHYGGLYGYTFDTINDKKKVQLSESDVSALKKVQETLECYSLYIKISKYGVRFRRNEKQCDFIYVYEDIDVSDLNSYLIEELSGKHRFKKIEKNWYNILRQERF